LEGKKPHTTRDNIKGEKQNGLHMETGKKEEQHELKED